MQTVKTTNSETKIAAEYRELREQIGTQGNVAKMLGVSRGAIFRRENGTRKITGEVMRGMRHLHAERVGGKTATAVPVKKDKVANAPAPNWNEVQEEKFEVPKTKHRPPRSLFQDQNNFYKLVLEVVAIGPEFDAFRHAEFVRVEFLDFSDVGRVIFKIKDPEAIQKLIDDAEEKTIPIVERFFRECEFLVAEV